MVLLQVKNYKLTTAEILYHLPDYPTILQTYIWQNMDLAPSYPELTRFLDFWESNLDGKLNSIRVWSASLVRDRNFRYTDNFLTLQ